MSQLLRKELGLLGDILIGALILLAGAFPLAFAGVYMQGVRPMPWISVLAGGCILNQYTMILTGALVGAVAFAREREEGNLQYLAALPIAPARQFNAKLLVCLGVWSVFWSINAAILVLITLAVAGDLDPLTPFLSRMISMMLLSFSALGGAALCGSFLGSVTSAAFAGLALVALAVALRLTWIPVFGGETFFSLPYQAALVLGGVAALILASERFRSTQAVWPGATPSAPRLVESPVVYNSIKWKMNTALLWKDFRLLLPALTIGAVLFLLPFAAAASSFTPERFRNASLIAMALSWVILPLWSAGSAANEWSAATHLFLAGLPIHPMRLYASKLLAAAAPAFIIFAACVLAFLTAQYRTAESLPLHLDVDWNEFNASHFLSGAVAYACALPAAFSVAWFAAARLRRMIVAMVLGIVAAPAAMAAWALTGAPGGILVDRMPPLYAVIVHALLLIGLSAVLIALGMRSLVRGRLV